MRATDAGSRPDPRFDPERDVVLDAHTMRGIAHPLRVKMLGMLREEGPATASRLAERLGESSGATSYHLRQLAAYGFVVEDAARGTARERWWRSAHRSTYFDLFSDEADTAAAGREFTRSIARAHAERLDAWVATSSTVDSRWRGASSISDLNLRLSPEEASDLIADIADLLSRYRADDAEPAPSDADRVTVQIHVLPRPRITS
jgi:DNA-binding transcriptional ArsR family regulator